MMGDIWWYKHVCTPDEEGVVEFKTEDGFPEGFRKQNEAKQKPIRYNLAIEAITP
jgi:hypothetical protein